MCPSDGFGTSTYWADFVRFVISDESEFDEKHDIYQLVQWFYQRLEASELADSDIWPVITYAFKMAEIHYYVQESQWDEVYSQGEEESVKWIINHVLESFDLYQAFKGCGGGEVCLITYRYYQTLDFIHAHEVFCKTSKAK